MEEGQLEDVMHRFVSGQTDVLVATTIIESGLDIPNANTIIIDRADRFGLADLYQLRGRVGRGHHKAYAYLMLPRDLLTVGEARKRINAIKQYSALGAGFKIALRDLEIRGAGNILGVAQSGHLTAIGFDLYCQLLRQAVGKLKGEKVRPRAEVNLRLDFVATSEVEYLRRDGEVATDDGASPEETPPVVWPAFLPAKFIEEPRLRIQAYRQLAEATRADDVEKMRASWRDRFGRLPGAAENLLEYTRFKLLAASRKLQQVELQGDKLMLTRGADFVLIGGRFPRLTSTEPLSKMRELFGLGRNAMTTKISSLLGSTACRLVVGLATLLAPFVSSSLAAPDVVDGVAALVNNDVITFSQVRELVGTRERSLRNAYSGQELVNKVREARVGALNDLIDRQLILQEFKKKEFAIPAHLIDERVEGIIRDDFGGDRQAFVRTLQAQGFTLTKFRDAERDKVIVQAMRYNNVNSDFIVSPGKIDSLYETAKPEYTTPEQIHLWMIAIDKGNAVGKGEERPAARHGRGDSRQADKRREV